MSARKPWFIKSWVCQLTLVAFVCLSLIPANTNASLIASSWADGSEVTQRAEQIDTIRAALEKEVVSQRLADFGLSPEEIAAKLPSLSDAQLHQLASLSEDMAAGGVLEAVIAILLIILLVVVILKLVDKEIVIR